MLCFLSGFAVMFFFLLDRFSEVVSFYIFITSITTWRNYNLTFLYWNNTIHSPWGSTFFLFPLGKSMMPSSLSDLHWLLRLLWERNYEITKLSREEQIHCQHSDSSCGPPDRQADAKTTRPPQSPCCHNMFVNSSKIVGKLKLFKKFVSLT